MYEKSCASSNHIKSWKDIDFGTAEYEVKKLQMRIAKAVKYTVNHPYCSNFKPPFLAARF